MTEASPPSPPLLRIDSLQTWFHTDRGVVRAVDDLTLEVRRGEVVGLVGESGSGKSVTSLSVMGLLPESASHPSGRVALLGRDLLSVGHRELGGLRGTQLAMVFQEPMSSLNPVLRVGEQVAEAIRHHEGASRADARARAVALLDEVGLPDPDTLYDRYPHELSGGQKQRVMIAIALSCDPELLIADEPTTALDVTVQAQILELLRRARRERGLGVLFITHDLAVVAELADRVAVMYRGRLVEQGDVLDVFETPRHPYTRALLACRPTLDAPWTFLPTVADFMTTTVARGEVVVTEREPDLDALTRPLERPPSTGPLLEVTDLHVRFPTAHDLLGRPTAWLDAVAGVSFTVPRGRTLGLVGESGCGKTTTGRAILRLLEPTSGTVRFDGEDLAMLSRGDGASRALRRRLQIVFQDPFSSLNPRHTVERILTEPMAVHGLETSPGRRRERAADLLREVDLDPSMLHRHPHEFSGGQRQRLCIARALALEPELIVCDESVSALDVSVQAQVLNLLRRLQRDRGLAYLFISHDLSVVHFMSDEVCVMKDGRIVERGAPDRVYREPEHPYTRSLIAAIPDGSVEALRRRRAAASP